ncbi:MAG TPA: DUF4368 domain-containing protein [Clostridiales bacterium]|nr:DUF4368 domain-containing protein [Clostridiales bacterium]
MLTSISLIVCRIDRIPNVYCISTSLVERATALKQTLDAAKEQNLNIDRFLKIVRKYTEITALSGEIIRDFIEKIIVYKRRCICR